MLVSIWLTPTGGANQPLCSCKSPWEPALGASPNWRGPWTSCTENGSLVLLRLSSSQGNQRPSQYAPPKSTHELPQSINKRMMPWMVACFYKDTYFILNIAWRKVVEQEMYLILHLLWWRCLLWLLVSSHKEGVNVGIVNGRMLNNKAKYKQVITTQ